MAVGVLEEEPEATREEALRGQETSIHPLSGSTSSAVITAWCSVPSSPQGTDAERPTSSESSGASSSKEVKEGAQGRPSLQTCARGLFRNAPSRACPSASGA